MHKSLLVCIVLVLPAFGQTAFNGTWRFDPKSANIKASERHYALTNGTWTCDTCHPKYTIKADGKEHSVSGSPYSDAAAVHVINDNTIEITSMKNGKQVGTVKMTASEDGNTLTLESTFVSENGQRAYEKDIMQRVGEAPSSGNKILGRWRQVKIADASENASTVSFKASDDGLSMSDGTGDSYTAKFDGKDYPYKGDPGTTSVSLKKINANTIEESDKRNGNVIAVIRMTVQPDGKTMKLEIDDKLRSDSTTMTAAKQ